MQGVSLMSHKKKDAPLPSCPEEGFWLPCEMDAVK